MALFCVLKAWPLPAPACSCSFKCRMQSGYGYVWPPRVHVYVRVFFCVCFVCICVLCVCVSVHVLKHDLSHHLHACATCKIQKKITQAVKNHAPHYLMNRNHLGTGYRKKSTKGKINWSMGSGGLQAWPETFSWRELIKYIMFVNVWLWLCRAWIKHGFFLLRAMNSALQLMYESMF